MNASDIARALDIGDAVDGETTSQVKGAIVHFAAYAREEAICAARELVDLDPFSDGFKSNFARLQNTTRRYQELVAWVHASRAEATEAYELLPDDEKNEMAAILRPRHEEVNDA
jgi:hypothetical protein